MDSVESAIVAEESGAGRVELCAGLVEGGLTPSLAMIRAVRRVLTKTLLFVIIRPRGGDFLYSHHEFDIMREDVKVPFSFSFLFSIAFAAS